MNAAAEFDIGPLSWVKGEIDLALERTASELAAVDGAAPTAEALKKALGNLHQAHGALAIVGLDGLTEYADAIEQCLQALADDKATAAAAVPAIQNGLSTLRAYLDDLMAGHPNQPLKLLPTYAALAEARGLPTPEVSELFFPDLTQRPPKREREVAVFAADALAARLKVARLGFERGLLKWIKGDAKGISEMKLSVAMIEMTRQTPAARAYWWITLGVMEALAADGLPNLTAAKKFALHLGAQIKKLVDGGSEVAEHLLREALYLCATASAGGEQLAMVRGAYRLEGALPSAEQTESERLLPTIRRLRDLLAAAKDEWNRLCAGTAAALPPFHERVTRIAEEASATGQAAFQRLSAAILAATDLLRRDPTRHDEILALEMATALLLAESALESFDTLDANFADQAEALASRLDALGQGEALAPLDMPHLNALTRRAQERLLLESVAREIRTNLGAIEQTLDAFFRDPAKQSMLTGLKQPIRQVEGALAVLGEERANSVLWECGQAIEEFAQPGFTPVAGEFEELAKKLSALGFFVEQLQHGPADIDAILDPQARPTEADEREPVALPATPTNPTPVTTVATTSSPTSAPESKLPALADAVLPASDATPATPASTAPTPSDAAVRMADASAAEVDAELLGIFLEEAHEVLAAIAEHLPRVQQAPDDHTNLTTLRRSFHTLKGSGRMVGLTDLGEAAWAVEQVMNRWLHEARAATAELQALLDQSYDTFRQWVIQLESGGSAFYDAADLERACDALMTDQAPEAPEAPAAPAGDLEHDLGHELGDAAGAEVLDDAGSGSADAVSPAPTFEIDAQVPEPDLVLPPVPVSADVVNFPAPPPIRVGDIEVAPTLYHLYVDETRGHIATLQGSLGLEAVPGNEVIRAAHTTASISAATGFTPIAGLAHALELALVRLAQVDATPTDAQRFVFARCGGALEGMLGAVAERRMPGEEATLTAELDAMLPAQVMAPMSATPVDLVTADALEESVAEPLPETLRDPLPDPLPEALSAVSPEPVIAEQRAPETTAPVPAASPEVSLLAMERRAQRMEDEIDAQLLPLFLEESVDLMREIGEALRAWRAAPQDVSIANSLQRALHTLKGSARMAGAMGCGELLHSMETRVDQAAAMNALQPGTLDGLETSYDRAEMLIERLRNPSTAAPVAEDAEAPQATTIDVTVETGDEAPSAAETDLAETAAVTGSTTVPAVAATTPAAQVHLRVRAELIDQLVNEAGEVAIARARIEGEMRSLKTSLLDLTENVIRLRNQLREVEIQAESQMQSQQALITEAGEQFDPLEFDRFTRFQEMTRMMAESVNDVATVQHGLLRNLDHADAALAAQGRLNRELSQRLMTVRMVPFESLAERLHRVVRQAAKDAGKRANLDIRHGQTTIDRSVLDKMAGPIEHLLRNSVGHGLEDRDSRLAAGKPEIGQITVSLAQEGNEIVIAISDDGAGLDFEKIRSHAVARGILAVDAEVDEAVLTRLIFQPGFSTAKELTTLSGRGIGMDVVNSETSSLGGRVEVSTRAAQGSTFRVYLPLTLAVTQAVLVRVGNQTFAIPSSMVEQASELKPAAIAAIREAGSTEWMGKPYPWRYLAHLLGESRAPEPARRHWLLLVKGGAERVALEVDGLTGNQEIVVKAIGPQLARVPGLAGATVLGDGAVALILNPIALLAHALKQEAADPAGNRSGNAVGSGVSNNAANADLGNAEKAVAAISVMVVDDSLTVRKISGRLLARQGYQVLTAKDGVDALEQLGDVTPDVMLVDIEMPRMDGFDLARNIRADARLKHIPIIMITSRTADKHRNHAMEIGVNHYMGKPYDEAELLGHIAELTKDKT